MGHRIIFVNAMNEERISYHGHVLWRTKAELHLKKNEFPPSSILLPLSSSSSRRERDFRMKPTKKKT